VGVGCLTHTSTWNLEATWELEPRETHTAVRSGATWDLRSPEKQNKRSHQAPRQVAVALEWPKDRRAYVARWLVAPPSLILREREREGGGRGREGGQLACHMAVRLVAGSCEPPPKPPPCPRLIARCPIVHYTLLHYP
jgi:hypothetical protein